MEETLKNNEVDERAENTAEVLTKEPSFEEHMKKLDEDKSDEDSEKIKRRRRELINLSSDFFEEEHNYEKLYERIESIEEQEKKDLAVAVLGELKGKSLRKPMGLIEDPSRYGFDREGLALALDYIEDEAKCKELLDFYRKDYYRCLEKNLGTPYASGNFYEYANLLNYSMGVVEDLKEGQGIDREMQPDSNNDEINDFIEGLGWDEAHDAGVHLSWSTFKEKSFYPKVRYAGVIVDPERPASEKGTVEYLARKITREYNALPEEEKKLKLAELDSLWWFYAKRDFDWQRIDICKELGDREETISHSVEQLARQACAINNMEKAVAEGKERYEKYQKASKDGKEILNSGS